MAQYAPQFNLFKIIDKFNTAIYSLFCVVFILSVSPSILHMLKITLDINDLLNTLNIITIALFFSFEILVEYILIPLADSKRRDDFIDNSFGSAFSTNASVGYYDTDELQKGLYKAACNLFENVFFSYSLIKALTIKKIIFPTIVLLAVIVFSYFGFKQVPFALSLLQALFSATLLGALIKHFILLIRLHAIQDAWMSIFQNSDFKPDTTKYQAYVYRYWLQYEALHSRIPAGIPDSFFQKHNSSLTQEWMRLKTRSLAS